MELSAALRLIGHPRLSAGPSACWADLGCGTGLFTTALAVLLPEGSTIYAVDKAPSALAQVPVPQRNVHLEKIQADFVAESLHLPLLDGLLMANSLHFVADREAFLTRAQEWLKPEGCFLVIEYDRDKANPWVPYPLSYAALHRLFAPLGYNKIEKLEDRKAGSVPFPLPACPDLFGPGEELEVE